MAQELRRSGVPSEVKDPTSPVEPYLGIRFTPGCESFEVQCHGTNDEQSVIHKAWRGDEEELLK